MKDYKQIGIQKLASSSTKEHYLLIYNGLYFEAGEAVVQLLSCLQDKSSEEEAIALYIERQLYQHRNGVLTISDNGISIWMGACGIHS